MTVKKRWIKQAKDGEIEAFERIMVQWEDTLYPLLQAWTDTQEQLRGYLGSIFLQAYQAFPAYSERESLQVWLFRIAVQVCGDPNVHTSSMEEGLEETPSRDALEYLRRLPVLYQKTLLLRECAGLTYEDIACVYRTEPMAVRLQISEARKKIAEDMGRESGCTDAWSDSISCQYDGELKDENRKKQLAAHLANCPQCQDYRSFLKQLTDTLIKAEQIPEALHESAMEVVMEDLRQRTVQYTGPKHHIPVFTLIGAAIAVVILVLSGSLGDFTIFKSSTGGTISPAVSASDSDPQSQLTQKSSDSEDAQLSQSPSPDILYTTTDDLLDIPDSVTRGKSYAYYSLAVGGGQLPEISGTLLAAEDNTVYMEISRDTQVLEKTDAQLQKVGFTMYQPTDHRVTISDQSKNALLVIYQED